jgi:hypothetical protein
LESLVKREKAFYEIPMWIPRSSSTRALLITPGRLYARYDGSAGLDLRACLTETQTFGAAANACSKKEPIGIYFKDTVLQSPALFRPWSQSCYWCIVVGQPCQSD